MPQLPPAAPVPQPQDYAIVAGLTWYPDPDIGPLDGPINDALAFCEWLTGWAGVPNGNIQLIVSKDPPPPVPPYEMPPTVAAFDAAFDKLRAISKQNLKDGKGQRVGRRLYLFFAGHGFTPQGEEAALLTANADRDAPYHVPPRVYANWFLHSGYFDEIVLFMDCCRNLYPQVPLRTLPYVIRVDVPAANAARTLYGFATKWSRVAREKKLPPGNKVRGIFSATLLAGLKGAASENGEVTARSLADYVYRNMSSLLDPEELEEDDAPRAPEFQYDNNPLARFVIAPAGIQKYPVRLTAGDQAVHETVTILDGAFHEVGIPPRAIDAAPFQWEVTLAHAGEFVARLAPSGRTVPFTVRGLESEAIHVQL